MDTDYSFGSVSSTCSPPISSCSNNLSLSTLSDDLLDGTETFNVSINGAILDTYTGLNLPDPLTVTILDIDCKCSLHTKGNRIINVYYLVLEYELQSVDSEDMATDNFNESSSLYLIINVTIIPQNGIQRNITFNILFSNDTAGQTEC